MTTTEAALGPHPIPTKEKPGGHAKRRRGRPNMPPLFPVAQQKSN